MSNPIQFNTTAGNRTIEARLDGEVTATGRLSPVLIIPLRLRRLNAPETAQIRLLGVVVEAACGGEILGQGWLGGVTLYQNGSNATVVRIPTSHRLLGWATDYVVRRGAGRLELRLYGAVQFRDTPDDEWIDEDIPYLPAANSAIKISRSDWHDYVLSPVRQADYLYLEVELARATLDGWEPALAQLEQAKNAYSLGNDSGVFHHLRGCMDALPGAKQAIVDAVADPDKRTAIDELVRAIGKYLHLGRHVSAVTAPEPGAFPVDRVDAGCALGLVEVLLAYLSTARPRDDQPT
ncbi:MAG: hypothetical protein ABIP57_00600 [Jatrophihabitantaceae bacterium]